MVLLDNKFDDKCFKLKAFFKGQCDKEECTICACVGKVTYIDSEKTYYLGLGKKESLTFLTLYRSVVKAINSLKSKCVNVDLNSFVETTLPEKDVFKVVIDAVMFADHERFTMKSKKCCNSCEKKTNDHKKECKNCHQKTIISKNQFVKEIFEWEKVKLEGVNFARDLQDTPPNIMIPETFAAEIKSKVAEVPDVEINILDEKKIKDEDMNLILAVNAASHNPPRVVVLKYMGDPSNKNITALIGKGITFDSGGYSLKPPAYQLGMKFDMSGAAIACSTVITAAKLKIKANIVAVASLTENSIGGGGTLVESVIKSKNGQTVEIRNTDAEGRLVNADGMAYAIHNCNADRLIELSTLTGAMLYALGKQYSGIFATDDKFYDKFEEASERAHEDVWRLPIHKDNYDNMRVSKIADISNVASTRNGGSSNAAAFLATFSEDKPFIHCDIAGTATNNEDNLGTGVLVKTLIELFAHTKF